MHNNFETVKPLLLSIAATATANLHEVLGVISLSLSITYTLYKFYNDKTNK